MFSHRHIKANGKVDLWVRGEDGSLSQVEQWPPDAMHSLTVSPDRYSLEKPADPEPEPEPEGEHEHHGRRKRR